MERILKTALMVEGGGMRGVFAAGVLDRFLEENFDPFDILKASFLLVLCKAMHV